MAHPEELEALTKAFSGLGVDEKSLISILGKSHPEHRKSFRKGSPHLFIEDERSFERWDDDSVHLLRQEFARFENALVIWAMHPWERDARLIYEALREGPQSYGVIVEIACTRSSEELLGARKAYHSLFDHSIEEDVATHISGTERKLLVALASAYRYEGPKVKEDSAKFEAKIFANAVKNGDKTNPIEDDEVIRILSTRSKPHLKAVYKHYKEISGNGIIEDLGAANLILKETVECLCTPHAFFSKVLDKAMRKDADHNTKKALTRVIVTQADIDLKEISEQYNSLYGIPLSKKVEETANGNYKDFLLALISREN
ncbi:annexin D4 [Ricinus communis]|uniref:Annexin, putative n=1 Tax=Ricinus communis TaxID=3988 RepID=B9RGC9_RICCO|nr:annexin D4 [Ricinus communis]EEF49584.1 annexin, putative [Ricinus communis]|eukprot:XP_002513081.1 annexin D4 [Ricinus communis]